MVKKDLYVFLECQKSVGPSGPPCPLQFNTHLWEGKEDGGEATTKTSTTDPSPQVLGGSVWWNLQSNTAAKAHLAPCPVGFKGAFLLLQEAQEISTQVLSCMLGQKAGPQVGCTIVDKVMRRGPKDEMCLPFHSHEGTYSCQFRP